MNTDGIDISFLFPPIPNRRFDWAARRHNYEPDMPIGYGKTPILALADLLEAEESAFPAAGGESK